MSESLKQVDVLLDGHTYSLITDEQEKVINEAAQLVKDRINAFEQKYGTTLASKERVAYFVALSIAADLAKRRIEQEEQEKVLKSISGLLE